jgi:excisionase family DNA binding protein
VSIDLDGLPTVLTVEQAGRLFGLGRSGSYDAVQRGELPVLRFGRRLVVPTARLLAMLGLEPAMLGLEREDEGDARPGAPIEQPVPAAEAEDRHGGS